MGQKNRVTGTKNGSWYRLGVEFPAFVHPNSCPNIELLGVKLLQRYVMAREDRNSKYIMLGRIYPLGRR